MFFILVLNSYRSLQRECCPSIIIHKVEFSIVLYNGCPTFHIGTYFVADMSWMVILTHKGFQHNLLPTYFFLYVCLVAWTSGFKRLLDSVDIKCWSEIEVGWYSTLKERCCNVKWFHSTPFAISSETKRVHYRICY